MVERGKRVEWVIFANRVRPHSHSGITFYILAHCLPQPFPHVLIRWSFSRLPGGQNHLEPPHALILTRVLTFTSFLHIFMFYSCFIFSLACTRKINLNTSLKRDTGLSSFALPHTFQFHFQSIHPSFRVPYSSMTHHELHSQRH